MNSVVVEVHVGDRGEQPLDDVPVRGGARCLVGYPRQSDQCTRQLILQVGGVGLLAARAPHRASRPFGGLLALITKHRVHNFYPFFLV